MRPSIMSEGPRMSQPASAWHQRHLLQRQQGLVVEDDAVADQAVVAVGIVGIERDVEQDADLRHRRLDRAGGAADQVLGVPGLGGLGVLVGGLGEGEEREAGDAEGGGLLGGADGAVDREPRDAGERGDGLLEVAALADEDRPDQVGRRSAGSRPPCRGSRGCGAGGAGGRAERGRAGSSSAGLGCGRPGFGMGGFGMGRAGPQAQSRAFTMPRRRGLTAPARCGH